MKTDFLDYVLEHDPYEEQKSEGKSLKVIFFIIQAGLLFFVKTRPYVLLFWCLGWGEVFLRIYLSSKREGNFNKAYVAREIGCAWKNSDLTQNILWFWPFDLLILLVQFLFKSDLSFSHGYREDKLRAYLSGRGKYYGMHNDTACEWSFRNIQEAEKETLLFFEKVEDIQETTQKRSRLAMLYASLISFLVMPFNWLQSKERDSVCSDINITSLLSLNFHENSEAIADDSFFSLLELFKKFASCLLGVIIFQEVIMPVRAILWNLIRPIRAIPIKWARVLNPVNAPPFSVIGCYFYH